MKIFGFNLKQNTTAEDIIMLGTQEWIAPEIAGTPPLPRQGHSSSFLNGKLYVFGGNTTDGEILNDLHVLHLGTGNFDLINSNLNYDNEDFNLLFCF